MENLMNATDEQMTRVFAREQRSNTSRASSSLDENIRLLLQHISDNPVCCGYPMMLEGVPQQAAQLGLLTSGVKGGGAGVVEHTLTDAGMKALAKANAELGEKATRYVHEAKYFGSLKPVVYGYPFQYPLSAPVRRLDGALVADRRGPITRFFSP